LCLGKIWQSRFEFFISFDFMPLGGPDQLHLRAAHGYIELEMFEEANSELEEIDAFCRHLPEVLLARLAIYHGLEKWDLVVVVAKKLVEWNPKEAAFFVELDSRGPRDSDASGGPSSDRRDDPVQSCLLRGANGQSRPGESPSKADD
jgi:hypothetical protein